MLRNNPCMRTPADRHRLLAAMTSLRSLGASLRYLDSPITLDERVQAWAHSEEGSPGKREEVRQRALLALSAPPGVAAEHVLELDLTNRRLRMLARDGALLRPYLGTAYVCVCGCVCVCMCVCQQRSPAESAAERPVCVCVCVCVPAALSAGKRCRAPSACM